MVSEQIQSEPKSQENPRFYSAPPVIINDNLDQIQVDPDYQIRPLETVSTRVVVHNQSVELTSKSDIWDKLTNVTFVLLLLGLLVCLALVIAICINPKIVGVEIDQRFLRILNDQETAEDRHSMLCLHCMRQEKTNSN